MPLPASASIPPAHYTTRLDPLTDSRPHAPRGKDAWDFALAAFWIALFCCLAIVAFAFLGPRQTVVMPDPTPAAFTLGSTRQQVRAVQGNPTAVEGNVWRYGASRVVFDGNFVVGWRSAPGDPLKAEGPPPKKK